jgi:ABC-type transport system involved in cytochrome bd biosynthesis fused ATPase/permease subunit
MAVRVRVKGQQKNVVVSSPPSDNIEIGLNEMSAKVQVKKPATKVVVNAPPKDRIEINTHGGIGASTGVESLVNLKDVDASSIDNNETVVYDEVSGKFVIKEIPIINGGTF